MTNELVRVRTGEQFHFPKIKNHKMSIYDTEN
jgi:hypothetical protein